MNINRYVSSDEAKRGLAVQVSASLASFKENGTAVLFLISGGSALGILDLVGDDATGPYLTMAVIDERYDPSNELNNFTVLTKTEFFEKSVATGVRFIDTSVKAGQERNELALAFEAQLRRWREEHPDGKMIAMLGMGPDGHTAGIFPDDDAGRFHDRFEGSRWVAGYSGPEHVMCPDRVTTTLTFLRNELDMSFIFFSGEEKRGAWRCVQAGSVSLASVPAGIWSELRNGAVYTDLD